MSTPLRRGRSIRRPSAPARPRTERRSRPPERVPIELRTLKDGGQTPTEIARELATFLGAARTSLDIAVYDVRFETDAGALVLATLLAAQQRGIAIRLVYNVDHPGPIPVPPPPETRPQAIEALPIPTRAIAGIPDLMHHKFVVRDTTDVWSGSTNWTDDSWSRQENVIVRMLDAPALARAFTLNLDELWETGQRRAHRPGRAAARHPRARDRSARLVHARVRRRAFAPGGKVPRPGAAADQDRVAGPHVRPDPRHARRDRERAPLRRRRRDRRDAGRQVFHQWATNGVSAGRSRC